MILLLYWQLPSSCESLLTYVYEVIDVIIIVIKPYKPVNMKLILVLVVVITLVNVYVDLLVLTRIAGTS